MDEKVISFVKEQARHLISAETCCGEARAAAQSWLDAVGTEEEAAETRKFIAELEEDIMTIDGLIDFAQSDMGAQVFGEAQAREIAEYSKQIKAKGAKYCDCPACAAAEAILEKKEQLLK